MMIFLGAKNSCNLEHISSNLKCSIRRMSQRTDESLTSNSIQVLGDPTSTSTGRAKTPTTSIGPSMTRMPIATRSTSTTTRTKTATRTRRRATTMPPCPRGTSASATPPARTASRGSVTASKKDIQAGNSGHQVML